jgi:hypothetical protein
MKNFLYFISFLFIFSCIEPYEFVVKNNNPTLVVEGYISDRSFTETLSYPSDGRFFTIKLSRTSDVTNVRSLPVTDAIVKLLSDQGEEWTYDPSTTPGLYFLNNNDFKAQAGVRYSLQITAGEEYYESDWEQLPDVETAPIGEVSFTEGTKQTYIVEANEPVLRNIQVVTARLELAPSISDKTVYYRWQFDPLWVYRAPLSPSATSPGHVCWARDPNYLGSYVLQTDNSGGYKKELFTIPTIRNERIFEDFSVLIIQHAMAERLYSFYNEMMEQNGSSVLIDKPPFNLETNIYSTLDDRKVSGYFGVVKEQATRWYFNKNMLSYTVLNTLKADCLVYYGPPLPGCPIPLPAFPACECKYCPEYSHGETTEVKPSWWRR